MCPRYYAEDTRISSELIHTEDALAFSRDADKRVLGLWGFIREGGVQELRRETPVRGQGNTLESLKINLGPTFAEESLAL
jgi:hypothetical protein